MSEQIGNEQLIQRIVVEHRDSYVRKLMTRLLVVLLAFSLFANVVLIAYLGLSALLSDSETADATLAPGPAGLVETFHSGDAKARDKIALIQANGVLMDDLTRYVINQAKRAQSDKRVRAVVLQIDSPGGLVADSEQIYHRLTELRDGKDGHAGKPIVVSMTSLGASGGYYIATAAGPEGKFFAEPSCITGSIGVIMPRYDVSKLLEKCQIQIEAITTGPMKDAGSPFRPFDDKEREYWRGILNQSYDRFLEVVAQARPKLAAGDLKALADGRVYTAHEALENGLIDEVGYVEDAVEEAKARAHLKRARVVSYGKEPSMLGRLLGASSPAPTPLSLDVKGLLEAASPRAYYLMGPALPATLRNSL